MLIVDEPTRGIDVGTKAEVHRLLSELAADGVAVLMVSSELPEVLGMADRVLVMHEGRLVADIPRARADEESVMFAATGHGASRPGSGMTPRRPPCDRPVDGARRAGQPGARGRRRPGRPPRRSSSASSASSLALVLLIAVTAVVNPRFLSAQSVKDLLLGSTILAILAVGQAIVIITRNVDLSVGSVLGLSAFATGSLFVTAPGTPIPVALLVGVALGAVCGAVNGALIAAARVPALVVTLGTLYVFRGLDYTWATGQQINAADMPPGFLRHGHRDRARRAGADAVRGRRAGGRRVLPALVPQRPRAVRDRLRPGRRAGCPASRSAGGSSPRSSPAARWPGSPACCTRPGSARSTPTPASGSELDVVAAVVVGGVAIFGGSGIGATARRSAPCCSPRSAARCRCSASTRSGSGPPSAR